VRDVAAVIDVELAERPDIMAALHALDQPWNGGPYSERTRAWLRLHAPEVVKLVGRFDALATRVAGTGTARVITHGEPHPGNVLDTGRGLVLIDWDTVGLAIPERDLWLVADDDDERERYADATEHRPDGIALDLYALRWQLADMGISLDLLRSPHVESADTEESWLSLDHCLQVARSL
jgi:spectinomycin phosphotransferase